ncbi:MAG: 50S ribosomal protein L11 methyltransferase [Alphaproteobacteria bacterium]|nr:50S ribosomal protein L11 methyltransferase [Alphaproteobacteria bacterium]
MWQILIKTKRDHLENLSTLIEDQCVTTSWVEIEDPNAAWDSEDWFIEGHMLEEPEQTELQMKIILGAKAFGIPSPEVTIQPLQETNWLEDMWEKFPPQTVGPFFVHSSHYKGDIPTDKTAIILDAATAFGSGEHGTTAGCMTALSDLLSENPWQKPLDLGCGSGILAIAATKLHPVPMLAIDNDAEAVRVTRANAILNGVEQYIQAEVGEGLAGVTAQFDLIIANILATPLIQLAPDIYTHLDNGGHVILSGLLDWQEEDVIKAYNDQGFISVRNYNLNRWITLVLRK